jgi:hypothetical protein
MTLAIHGGKDRAKTWLAKVLRSLVDPNETPLNTVIPEERAGIFAEAQSQHVLAYENVGVLTREQSNTLASIATGGGIKRRLFNTNFGLASASALKPIMMNGIARFIMATDLSSRTIFLDLPAIPASAKKEDSVIKAMFEERRPLILGALFDAMVMGLRRFSSIKVYDLYAAFAPWAPRMPFFNRWTAACETSFGWETGSITRAHHLNVLDNARRLLQENKLGLAIQEQMNKRLKKGITRIEAMPDAMALILGVPFTLSQLTDISDPLRLLGYHVDEGDWRSDISLKPIVITRTYPGIAAPQGTPRIT